MDSLAVGNIGRARFFHMSRTFSFFQRHDGEWMFTKPFMDIRPEEDPMVVENKRMCLPAIWTDDSPLRPLETRDEAGRTQKGVRDVIHHIWELDDWLSPYSDRPVKVSKEFCTSDGSLTPQGLLCETHSRTVIAVMLKSIERLSILYPGKFQQQIEWISADCRDSVGCVPDEPTYFLKVDLQSCALMDAVSALFRYPSVYDKGYESTYESLLGSQCRLLLDGCSYLYTSDWTGEHKMYGSKHPLLISWHSKSEMTDVVATAIATEMRPSLEALMEHERLDPECCFTYGLHWSPTRLTILVHFLVPNSEGSTNKVFHQVAVAQHWTTIKIGPSTNQFGHIDKEKVPCCNEDEVLLDQWRMLVALLSVRRHTEALQETIGVGEQIARLMSPSSSQKILDDGEECATLMSPPRFQGKRGDSNFASVHQTFFEGLRCKWERPFAVPENWIPDSPIVIRLLDEGSDPDNTRELLGFCWKIPGQIARLYLRQLREVLHPLTPDVLKDRNGRSAEELNPDPTFSKPVHLPHPHMREKIDKLDINEKATDVYLYKLYDFLSMRVDSWRDVNLYIAHLISGWKNYTLQWKHNAPDSSDVIPTLNTDSTLDTDVNHRVILDFVVLPRPELQPKEVPHLQAGKAMPPAAKGVHPTFFFCAHSRDTITSALTTADRDALQIILSPMSADLKSCYALPDDFIQPSSELLGPKHAPIAQTVILGTILKAGVIHILAVEAGVDDNHTLRISTLDSIPLSMAPDHPANLVDRMQLAMALFTIHQHLVQVSNTWVKLVQFIDLVQSGRFDDLYSEDDGTEDTEEEEEQETDEEMDESETQKGEVE